MASQKAVQLAIKQKEQKTWQGFDINTTVTQWNAAVESAIKWPGIVDNLVTPSKVIPPLISTTAAHNGTWFTKSRDGSHQE